MSQRLRATCPAVFGYFGSRTSLCASLAVLLTACGGSGTESTAPPPQLAATLSYRLGGVDKAAADTGAAALLLDGDLDIDTADLLVSAGSEKTAPRDLYVSTTGSDSNPGTQSEPFLTITRAARSARADTTVHVAPGTYSENIKTRTHGSAAARIRYVSDIKWGARIIGSGTGAMWTNTGNYVDIVGFDVSGSGRLGILNQGSYTLVAGNHVHDLTISGGCSGSGGAGIVNANYSASDGDVIGNVVHDIGIPGRCSGVQGIYSSNLRGRIHNNIVYRVSAWGIHLWHAANNVMIANNTVFANGAGGMGGGIVIGSGDRPGGVILNNTKVINNIVYRNPAAGIKQYCYSGQNCIGANNLISHNLVYGNGSVVSLRVGRDEETIAAEPEFVDYQADGSGNYRLKGSSPAINQGLTVSAPAADIDNVARPRGGAPDIGAYENQ
jgi:hypothetical protein